MNYSKFIEPWRQQVLKMHVWMEPAMGFGVRLVASTAPSGWVSNSRDKVSTRNRVNRISPFRWQVMSPTGGLGKAGKKKRLGHKQRVAKYEQ